MNTRHQAKFMEWFVNHPVMVITFTKLELHIAVVYTRSNFHGLAKVERCAIHRL